VPWRKWIETIRAKSRHRARASSGLPVWHSSLLGFTSSLLQPAHERRNETANGLQVPNNAAAGDGGQNSASADARRA